MVLRFIWLAALTWAVAEPADACPAPRRLTQFAERLLPAVPPAEACALAVASAGAAGRHRLDPRWLLTLVRLESSGRPVHVWYPPKSGSWGGRADFSYWQIHSTTAEHFGCDILGLLEHDPEAGAECAAKVLIDARNRCSYTGSSWVGCYHSSTDWRRDAYARRFWEVCHEC